MGPRDFPYGRSFFYLRAVLLIALFSALLLFLGLQTVTPQFWLGVIAAVLLAYLGIVGLSPLLTHHTLLRSRLILRQGWYFRAVIPFSNVEEVGPWDGEPKYGLKVGLAHRTMYIVGSAAGLVSIQLREPRRFPQALFLKAREIVFDVDDRDAFLAAVKERTAAPAPLPAHKVLVLPPGRR
ncbi:MAG: hypothetical protein AABY30_01685 [Candidatus Thermoplasmatota archaeon]